MRGAGRWSLLGAVVLAAVLVATASSSAATAASRHAARPGRGGAGSLAHCVRALLAPGGTARPVAGSADPGVRASFAIFRRPRSSADRLRGTDLRRQLGLSGARTYDPSAAVRLSPAGARDGLYAVPATVGVPPLPAGCAGRRRLAGVNAYLAMRRDAIGSGPGACLITTELVAGAPSRLPGRTRPGKALEVTGASCGSMAVLSGYVGAFSGGSLTPRRALIPDGIASVTYTLADGRALTAPVNGNIVTPPAALFRPLRAAHLTARGFARLLSARLPTSITETGPTGATVATLPRPASLIADTVGGYIFLRRLSRFSTTSRSSSTSGSASCSARTHRCVAVTVTMTCSGARHCHIGRTIHRYRYRTARPPLGTTHAGPQPTGPILARVLRVLTRPTRVALVLRGTPRRRVDVLLAVMCSARSSGASISEPPLRVAVPSRTPIPLPGRARSFRVCDIGALVVSRGRGAVHASVVRIDTRSSRG